jgi:hypothetical protein
MKSFITILLVALACLCLVQDANAWIPRQNSDPITCYNKSPDVHSAITNFCSRNSKLVSQLHQPLDASRAESLTCKQVAPSRKAADGAWSNKNKISVWIHGSKFAIITLFLKKTLHTLNRIRALTISVLSDRRKLQAPAMDPGEVVLPQLLQHVCEHEQELQGDRILRQGWRMSDLAYQAVLIGDRDLWAYTLPYTAICDE